MKRMLFVALRILMVTVCGLIVGSCGIIVKSEEFRNAIKSKLSRVAAKIKSIRLR